LSSLVSCSLFCFVLRFLLFVSLLCFFFSSRRRHTRSKRDWSSDVCSSDLILILLKTLLLISSCLFTLLHASWLRFFALFPSQKRSEERRVGKECRSRRPP